MEQDPGCWKHFSYFLVVLSTGSEGSAQQHKTHYSAQNHRHLINSMPSQTFMLLTNLCVSVWTQHAQSMTQVLHVSNEMDI